MRAGTLYEGFLYKEIYKIVNNIVDHQHACEIRVPFKIIFKSK